jgi:hypothetical protein
LEHPSRALPGLSGIAFATLVFVQMPGIDGPHYWRWFWQHHPDPLLLALVFGAAAVPALAAQLLRDRLHAFYRVALICLSSVGLVCGSVAFHPGFTPALVGLMTPVIVAVSGQVQAETARLWAFLIPGVAFAAALEISKWPACWRIATYASLALVTIALYANLGVINASMS